MSPSAAFTTAIWVAAVQGIPPDPQLLRQWRLAPPRLRTREAVDADPTTMSRWSDTEQEWPLAIVAMRSAVTEGTVQARCRRWGIDVHERIVAWEGQWPKRQRVLTEPAFRAYMARAVTTVGLDRRPRTSRAS